MKAIVLANGAPLELCFPGHGVDKSAPRHGVLLFGRFATVFPDRRAAFRAITRTLKWAESCGHPWNDMRHRVVSVTEGASDENE